MWKVIAISNDISLEEPGKMLYFAVLSNGRKTHRLPVEQDIALEIATDRTEEPKRLAKKPTIEELEQILEEDESTPVRVERDGSLTPVPVESVDHSIDELTRELQNEERALPGLRPVSMKDLEDTELPPEVLDDDGVPSA